MKSLLCIILFFHFGVLYAQKDSTEATFPTIFGPTPTFSADSLIKMNVLDNNLVGNWKLETMNIKGGKLKGSLSSADTLATQLYFNVNRSLQIISSLENTFGYWKYTEPKSITIYGASHKDSSLVFAHPVKLTLIKLKKNKLIIETNYGRRNTKDGTVVFWFIYRKM